MKRSRGCFQAMRSGKLPSATVSRIVVLLALILTSAAAQRQPNPAAEYQVLLTEYSTASGAFRAAQTDLQRKQAVEQLDEFPQKLLVLAETHRTDPVALLALRQAVQAVNQATNAELFDALSRLDREVSADESPWTNPPRSSLRFRSKP